MKRLKAILMLVVALVLMSSATMKAQNKREFRGAWIQCRERLLLLIGIRCSG